MPKYHKRKEFSLLHNCILSYGGKAAHVIVPNSKSTGGLRDFMLRKANKNNNINTVLSYVRILHANALSYICTSELRKQFLKSVEVTVLSLSTHNQTLRYFYF